MNSINQRSLLLIGIPLTRPWRISSPRSFVILVTHMAMTYVAMVTTSTRAIAMRFHMALSSRWLFLKRAYTPASLSRTRFALETLVRARLGATSGLAGCRIAQDPRTMKEEERRQD